MIWSAEDFRKDRVTFSEKQEVNDLISAGLSLGNASSKSHETVL